MELIDLGKALLAQLAGSRRDLDQHPVFRDHPLLLSRLVSKLTYCVREAPPRFIAVDMASPTAEAAFNVAVFTDDHVFQLSYDPMVDHITTTVVSRKSIRAAELLSAPNFMAGDQPGTFEGGLEIRVTYDEISIRLPGDNFASDRNRQELDVFWPSLLRDLAQRQ
ncbi:MAG: hypothetical protein JWM49_217 [Microbacteriaceae bacterium]|nr:hypothetical protein [Microbacteriaceae bacterium]